MSNTSVSNSFLSSSHRWKRDVFLSFRGEDTRRGFTDHLYNTLRRKGIDVFRDDEKLERGKDIAPELLRSIEESRFAVVIFSRDYASSTWCLDELQKIAECKKSMEQTVLPVFHGVDPSNVRKQKGEFLAAFEKHEQNFKDNMDKVKKWRKALTELASVSGWDLTNRHESEVIQEIAKTILSKLNLVFSSVNKDLVGIDSRITKMDSYLDIGSDEVRTIGIWGAGGIGKTTIAKQVFKRIHDQFEASCFLANVREESQKHGIVRMQTRLYDILVENQAKIQMDDMGMDHVLERALHSKRVLVVLDDVDQLKQLEALVGRAGGQHKWFGSGSRIIVTTRDKHLLKIYGNIVFEVEKLNDVEALQLFSQKAFNQDCPEDDDYNEMSKNVVKYANGLPLALEVLGSFLYGRDKDEWLGTINRLRENPKSEIYKTLRLSYDGLEHTEKQMFLDIACFFKGEDIVRVKKIFDSCKFHPTIGLRVLNEKSLIFDEGGKLWMHDLLQQMGWEIVREESLEDPGKRSRLWLHKDSYHVLTENKGTNAVQGIFLDSQEKEEMLFNADPFSELKNNTPVRIFQRHLSPSEQSAGRAERRYFKTLLGKEKEVHLNYDAFLELKNLRFLKICNIKVVGCQEYFLPKSLRLLEWHGCPLKSLPSNFQLDKLVELSMPNSRIEQMWKSETIRLGMLISIDLSDCYYLTNTPDFTKAPNLEILILDGCGKLKEVHPSIGVLRNLVLLNLNGCKCLEKLPDKISLTSLKMFILSGCWNLNKFPEIVEDMKNLSQLYLDGTAIWELPVSINRLIGLTLLDLSNCKNLSSLPSNELCSLTALRTLRLSGCSRIDQLPENLGSLKELEELYANGTALRKVPSSVQCLENLKYVSFRGSNNDVSSVTHHRSWKSLICCCLLPTDQHYSQLINLQLPSSFAGLTSLVSLDLSQCHLEEGAIPNDIGCLSSLQYLYLSGNNFRTIPASFSQLSKLMELDLSDCGELLWLPNPLPLSLKYLYARNCPKLNNELSHYHDVEVFISDKGLHFIDCRTSSSFDDDGPIMPEEYVDLLFPKYVEDQIKHGRPFDIIFPYPARSNPEWCSKWSSKGSSITIKLSPEDNFGMRKGFALFFALEIKEQNDIHQDSEQQKTACLFHTDEGEKLSLLPNFKVPGAGSYGVCCYRPRGRFNKKYLNEASSVFGALVLTERQDMKIKMCGLHIIFEQDVQEFSQKLSETFTEFQNLDSKFIHCKKLLDAARELREHGNYKKSSMAQDYTSSEPQQDDVDQTLTTNDPYSSSKDSVDDCSIQMRRDTYTLLSRLFEGRSAHNRFSFVFPRVKLSYWFSHHCVGDTTICYLPPSLYDNERWVGLDVYAICERPDPSENSSLLFVDLYVHGTNNGGIPLPILTYSLTILGFVRSFLVVSHIPRESFPKQLNQCQGISVLFRPAAPAENVKIDFSVLLCGTRLLYEKDSESFIQEMISLASVEPSLLQLLHDRAKLYVQEAEEFLRKDETHEEPAGVFRSEWSLLQSLQKLLTSTDPLAKDVSTTLEKYRFYRTHNRISPELGPMLAHSEAFVLNILQQRDMNYHLDNLSFCHFHIMPDMVLRFGRNSADRWKHKLKFVFEKFSMDNGLFITLSVGGNLISVSNYFDPMQVYNFCFPQKEILEWFLDRSSKSRMAIELPPHLYDDSSWAGLAVCASFLVNEHPNAFSETYVDLLCHLSADRNCLNPVPCFSVTKDRYKWLHVRGFIWLTYLPREFLTELNQRRNLQARIFSSCPGLIVNMCGIRLLYHQDVKDFRRAMRECATSIFDTLDETSFGITDEQNTTLYANDSENSSSSRVLNENTSYQSTFHQTSNEEFHQNSIYNSCFLAVEIQEWFRDQYSFNSSGKIHLPPDISHENNWLGFTMCAYFSDLETTYIDNNSDAETVAHITLTCQFGTERGSIEPPHYHQTTQEDLSMLYHGGLMWLSFLPRQWFDKALRLAPYPLNDCRVMEASFRSNKRGLCVQRCAFRLLYQHDEEEFRQAIRHCVLNTSSSSDKKTSEGPVDQLLKDKGKGVME